MPNGTFLTLLEVHWNNSTFNPSVLISSLFSFASKHLINFALTLLEAKHISDLLLRLDVFSELCVPQTSAAFAQTLQCPADPYLYALQFHVRSFVFRADRVHVSVGFHHFCYSY
jgi:hypothetical protein